MRAGSVVAAALAFLAAAAGRAEDRVSVRGTYFREHSTRVVQPIVEVSKDLPYGLDVGTHFLVDSITSASVAAGVGTDNIFTEMRKEAGVVVGETFRGNHVALGYRQSREPDYISHSMSASFIRDVWENSGTVTANLAFSTDTIGPMLDKALKTWFAGAAYSQALTPTLILQGGYDLAYLDGYQANPYVQVFNKGRERVPSKRFRHAFTGRLAYYLPGSRTGLQAHYRYYLDHGWKETPDPWKLRANTIEGDVFQELGPGVEVRLTYRHHSQGAAAFWCNSDPTQGGTTDCYGPMVTYWAMDAKLGPEATHIFEAQLTWNANPLARVPVLAWFSGGSFDISYGRYVQDTRYGSAHLLQTGYTLAF